MTQLLASVSIVFEFITSDQRRVVTHYSSHNGRFAWTVFLSERCVYNEWADIQHIDSASHNKAWLITTEAIKDL